MPRIVTYVQYSNYVKHAIMKHASSILIKSFENVLTRLFSIIQQSFSFISNISQLFNIFIILLVYSIATSMLLNSMKLQISFLIKSHSAAFFGTNVRSTAAMNSKVSIEFTNVIVDFVTATFIFREKV